MAESLKVLTAPEKVKDLPASGDRPALVVWRFAVKRGGEDGQTISTELLKHPGNDPPAEGTMVLGDLTQNDYGWRLKLANEGGQRSGGGGQRGGPKSPDERRSIERQVAAKAATDLTTALIAVTPTGGWQAEIVGGVFSSLFDAVDAKIAGGS